MKTEAAVWLPNRERDQGRNLWDLPRGINAIKPRAAQAAQRARLFYAMTESITQHGYSATAVADVLTVAKISRRTFYQLFKDKEDCYLALFQKGHEALVQAVLEAQKGARSWHEHLELSHRAYLDFFVRHPKLAHSLLVEVVAAGPRALQARDRYHARFTRFQQNLYEMRRAEEPGLPPLPAETFSVLIAGIDDLVGRWVREGRGQELLKLEAVVLYIVSSVHGGRSGPL